MKNTLLIALILIANFVSAQTFTKYVDNTQTNGQGFCYNVTIRLTLLRMAAQPTLKSAGNGTEYLVQLVRLDIDKSKGWYERGKTYNCDQLEGICNLKNYDIVNIGLAYNCAGREIGSGSATFYNVGDKQTIVLNTKDGCSSPTASGIDFISIGNNENSSRINLIVQKLNNGKSIPATQAGTTNTSNQTNNTTAKPLDNYDPNTGLYTNPMANNANSGSSAVNNFNKGYQQGQQIVNAVTPFLDAWSKKIDRDNAKHVAYQEDRMREGAIRKEQYNSYCAETNKKLLNWEYFQKNVIQKIPFLLKSTSPTWESILGSEKLAFAFGKDAQFIVKNFNSYDYGDKQVLIKLKKESLNREKSENIAIKENTTPINYFYSVDVGVHYRYKYFMNGVNISDTHFHNCGFIYNANNIVIGIYINIATSVWGNSKNIHSYFMDILSKIGNEFIMLDANTFLLKDKLIFIEYDVIRMYDLKYFNHTLLLKSPLIYSTVDNSKIKYKVAGVKFKLDDVKTVNPSFLKKENIIEKNESNVKGIIIGEVIKNSSAEKAGLQANDIITVVHGFTVKSPYIFQLIVQGYSSEGKLNVTYIRDGIEYNTIMNLE